VDERPLPPGWISPLRRKSPRIAGYDYTSPGIYFVTLCAAAGQCVFGEVVGGVVRLNDIGRTVAQCWESTPRHFLTVELDLYVVMPNHVHGLLALTDTADAPSSNRPRPTVHTVVGAFKSAATRQVNILRDTPGAPLWQRAYYEHVVRTDQGLERIRAYIAGNPAKWELDEENPARRHRR
jgi:putative transposase